MRITWIPRPAAWRLGSLTAYPAETPADLGGASAPRALGGLGRVR
ncbi:MAG: hypothetical protein P1V36_08820 [Planctomycetota bacterium]|nr:hypothetical protein [Planctomycetota bacterium]